MAICALIVDDDPLFREALGSVLREAEFTVRTAADGAEALHILDKEHDSIDVVIVDLNLPEVSGFEVIGAITRRANAMGILATTAAYKQTYLDLARHMGANIAIRKATSAEELKAWIPAIQSIVKAEKEMSVAARNLV